MKILELELEELCILLLIKKLRFIRNTAFTGGEIYVDNLNVEMRESYLRDNLAYRSSRCMYVYGKVVQGLPSFRKVRS